MCIRDSPGTVSFVCLGALPVTLTNFKAIIQNTGVHLHWSTAFEKNNRGYEVERSTDAVSYTHLRAHETVLDLVCRLLLEKKKQQH